MTTYSPKRNRSNRVIDRIFVVIAVIAVVAGIALGIAAIIGVVNS